jgi:hypothetical protein
MQCSLPPVQTTPGLGSHERSTICKLEAKRQRTNEFPGPTCEQLCTSTNHIVLLDISAKYFCGTRCQTLLKDTIATQFLRDIFVRHTRHTKIKHFCHTFYSNAYIGHFVKHSRVEGGIHSFYANMHLQIRQCINKGTKV